MRLLGVITAFSTAGTAASPYLVTRAPALLMVLCPRLTFLVLAAQHIGLVPFVLIGLIRLGLADPLHFVIGRRVGHSSRESRWFTSRERLRNLVEAGRRQRDVLAYVGVAARPNGAMLAFAGSTGAKPRLVAALDVVGTCIYLAVVHAGATSFH